MPITQLELIEVLFDGIGETSVPRRPDQTCAVIGRLCTWSANSRRRG
jgi:hypothetical protein